MSACVLNELIKASRRMLSVRHRAEGRASGLFCIRQMQCAKQRLMQVLAACLRAFHWMHFQPSKDFTDAAMRQLLTGSLADASAEVECLRMIYRLSQRPSTQDLILLEQKVCLDLFWHYKHSICAILPTCEAHLCRWAV